MERKTIICLLILGAALALFFWYPNGNAFSKSESQLESNEAGHLKTVTEIRLWRCPKCSMILRKGLLGRVWHPGDPISTVAGMGTCSNCGARYPQSDIYGGKYDVNLKARIASNNERLKKTKLSVVVYLNSAVDSATDAYNICSEVAKKYYPKAFMDSHYVVTHLGALTLDEAYVNYTAHLSEGKLPDLGEQFDALKTKHSDGEDLVVLFFR